jgi:rubrerythrin
MPRMAEPVTVSRAVPIRSAAPTKPAEAEKALCDRCGREMFRMHAVWRCPACGFKTDCCGW